MRFSKSILVLVALASVAGCAAPAASMRGPDTAVRAEPRQISYATGFAHLTPGSTLPATVGTSQKAIY